jgi:hypothetical protein
MKGHGFQIKNKKIKISVSGTMPSVYQSCKKREIAALLEKYFFPVGKK